MDVFLCKLCDFISHISWKTLSASRPAAPRRCQARRHFRIDRRRLLCEVTPHAVAVCPDPGRGVSLPAECRFRSGEHWCVSFGRISFHSTHLFFKGKICFQAPPERRGLPKIRVTNWHAGNELGSLNAVAVPGLPSEEAQAGAQRFRRSQLTKCPPSGAGNIYLLSLTARFTASLVPGCAPAAFPLNQFLFIHLLISSNYVVSWVARLEPSLGPSTGFHPPVA